MTCTQARKRSSYVIMAVMALAIFGIGYGATAVQEKAELAQAQRDEQARRAELIVLSAPVPIVMCGEDSHITVCNPAAEKFFGWTHDGLLGKHIDALLPENFRAEHAKAFAHAAAHARDLKAERYAIHRECPPAAALHKDGSILSVQVSLRVIKYGDSIEFIAVIRRVDGKEPDGGFPLPELEQRMQQRIQAAR